MYNAKTEMSSKPKTVKELGKAVKRRVQMLNTPKTWLIIASIVLLVASAVPFIVHLFDYPTPAFVRGASVLPTAFFGFVLVAVALEPLWFKPWLVLITAIIGLIVPVVALVYEASRWSRCNGVNNADVTDVENTICLDFTAQVWIGPVIFIVIVIVSLAVDIYLFSVARSVYDSRRLLNQMAQQERNDAAARAKEEQGAAFDKKTFLKSFRPVQTEEKRGLPRVAVYTKDFVQVVFNVLMVAVLLFVVGVHLFSMNAAAFYRAGFLAPVTMLVAAHLAMWRTPLTYWRWVVFGFSLLTIFASVWGGYNEFTRYDNCLNGTPDSTTENFVCTYEGWLIPIVPFVLLAAAIVGVVNLVLSVWRFVEEATEA
jgi:hypothetical protein